MTAKIHDLARRLGVALFCMVLLAPVAALADDEHLAVHTGIGDFGFTVEIADDDPTRAKGLMFREALAPDKGRLSAFPTAQPVAFVVKNPPIPLDMIFIAADGTIRNVHVNAVPHDETPIPSDGAVRFVLEVAGGRSVEMGVQPGDKVTSPRIPK